MSEWLGALGFGIGLLAFVLGVTSIIMGFMASEANGQGMQHKIEYGFFGVAGLIVSLLMGYALA